MLTMLEALAKAGLVSKKREERISFAYNHSKEWTEPISVQEKKEKAVETFVDAVFNSNKGRKK